MRNFFIILLSTILLCDISHAKIKKPKTINEATKFYWKHIETATPNQVIAIPKTTLACNTKSGIKKGIKALLSNSPRAVFKYGCHYTRIFGAGLITDMSKNSRIVRIAYRLSENHKGIGHSYFYWPHVFTQAQYAKLIA